MWPKYYKEIESQGITWRLEIYQNTDEEPELTEIGPVLQDLRLVVQGDQADVDTPIVKTSLEMTFVDAPELELGKTDRKCGDWEEFYTSDATEYLVKLYKDGEEEWSGYITPYSFSEDLQYMGSVQIIARDNLGTLQDRTFNAMPNRDGKVYASDVIALALESCLDMWYDYGDESFPFAVSESPWPDSGYMLNQLLDADELRTMTWWDALEKALYSIGAVLRYVGRNHFVVVPLRDVPKMGRTLWADVPVKPVQFLSYGHRELVPGVKSITETQNFAPDYEAEAAAEIVTNYELTAKRTLPKVTMIGPNGSTGSTPSVPVSGYFTPSMAVFTVPEASCLLDVKSFAKVPGHDAETFGAWDDDTIIYMAVNSSGHEPVKFAKRILTDDSKATVSFSVGPGVTLTQDLASVLNLSGVFLGSDVDPTSFVLSYRIRHTNEESGAVQYYDKSAAQWKTSAVTNQANARGVTAASFIEESVELPVYTRGEIVLELVELYATSIQLRVSMPVVGLFGRVKNVQIIPSAPEDFDLMEKRTITTNYSDRYAVRLTRDPHFAVLPSNRPEIAYVPTAILTEGPAQYYGSDDWVWMHGRNPEDLQPHTGAMLTRLIHQQLLCYYDRPNNLLTGELFGEDLSFDALYEWKGQQHLLMSGALNILTGRMENAVLRGFQRYERLWETYAEHDAYTVKTNGTEQVLDIVVRSQKTLTANDIRGLGGELLNYGMARSGNKYTYHVGVAPTGAGMDRVVRIDSAMVLIRVE